MAAASEYTLEPIRDRAEFTLFRARQRGTPMPLLAVAPIAEPPPPRSLQRLEHEYSLTAELEHTWAAKPLALTRHEGRTILVLADPGGEPLDCLLERDREQSLDLARFLYRAINLATALGHVHERGLIHKDVKPENVLVDDASHVWLAGFGIASRLPPERQTPVSRDSIEGTLAYMSPEQTGRMKSMTVRTANRVTLPICSIIVITMNADLTYHQLSADPGCQRGVPPSMHGYSGAIHCN